MDEDLKQKLEIICSFANTKPTFINGSIRSIEKTNLNYIEPHRVIIKGITFLAFNYDKYILTIIISQEKEVFSRIGGTTMSIHKLKNNDYILRVKGIRII